MAPMPQPHNSNTPAPWLQCLSLITPMPQPHDSNASVPWLQCPSPMTPMPQPHNSNAPAPCIHAAPKRCIQTLAERFHLIFHWFLSNRSYMARFCWKQLRAAYNRWLNPTHLRADVAVAHLPVWRIILATQLILWSIVNILPRPTCPIKRT
jgi:hypothetical protein